MGRRQQIKRLRRGSLESSVLRGRWARLRCGISYQGTQPSAGSSIIAFIHKIDHSGCGRRTCAEGRRGPFGGEDGGQRDGLAHVA